MFSFIISIAGIISVLGIIYPFRPFRRRSRALMCLIAVIFVQALVDSASVSQKDATNMADKRISSAIDVAQSPVIRVDNKQTKETQMWVTASSLFRRTCPSTNCGIVGKFFYRESTKVFETSNGWGRVSIHYDASCSSGLTKYVDSGRANCTEDNGIRNGRFAEWMKLNFLSTTRPPDPAASATGTAKLVGASDDFKRYKNQFVRAANSLMASRKCVAKDFTGTGGWIKSSNKGYGIYFTYCKSLRIYLDVSSGRIFQ